jgi:predicted nucleotidyltransferase
MDKVLGELVERMKKAFGADLLSVVLYGSASTGDRDERHSDFNILAVLRAITPRELRAAEPVFRWWHDLENPSPLLMTPEEIRESTDCFPIEFHDICEFGRVLHGEDFLKSLVIDDRDYRAEVEHELRGKLLRLRQKAAGVMLDRHLLLRLMTDSVSTFCVLFRHALALRGEPRRAQKREIVDQARAVFAIDPAPLLTLLDLRDGRGKPGEVEVARLLESYLIQIQTVVAAVNSPGHPAFEGESLS